jgi:hypothetical protein
MANRTRVETDGLGDWRIQAVAPLASDVPPAYPGGPSHKANSTTVVLTTRASTATHHNLFFTTPSATALALDGAFRAAQAAADLWPQIKFVPLVTPDGPGTGIENAPVLFNFFAESMAAAGSGFQAIEAFANETIVRDLKGAMTLERRRGPEELNAEEIERHVSTEEKIASVLPRVLNISSIKGSSEWAKFVLLKNVRDATIHFKSGDQYPLARGGKVSESSLYHILLNNDPRQFPLIALRVIWRLRKPTAIPRWLNHLAEKHGVA